MEEDKRSFRFELNENLAQNFVKKFKEDGYKSYAEWVRERIREYMNS